jgi:CPA1 family monovalent cation:H+ antiporter
MRMSEPGRERMFLFELLIGLLFAGAMFALLADRLSVPYPALLACVGVLLALVPGAPGVELDPELALALFVAPTLLDAAYDASPRDLRNNLASVAGLAVILVLLTVSAVAWAARQVVPEMGWAAAIALGAIVAPPDASAATAMLRKLQPPHRLMVILEGESMFNDAVSLIIYRVAVTAAMTGAFSGWSVFPVLLVSAGGGVAAGWALARIQIWIGAHVDDIPVNVLMQFIGTFAAWIIADKLGLSAIITVIVFAMTVARRVGGGIDARRRIASYAVWDVAVLVLNVLAFVLIGLQLRGIASRVHGPEWRVYAACAGAVCAAAILVRVAWVFAYVFGVRWKRRRFGPRDPAAMPTYGGASLASWCGMRGIVTLAAALALPVGASGFPHRDLIVFSAFCAVLFTLVLQGFTLRPLMRLAGLKDDGLVEREITVARAETARAALRELDRLGEGPSVDILRSEYRVRMRYKEARVPGGGKTDAGLAGIQRRAVLAQRDALRDLRARRVIGDDAFHVVEEEIDLLELTAEIRVEPGLDGEPA